MRIRDHNEVHSPETRPKIPNITTATMMPLRRPIRSARVPNANGPMRPAIRLELKSGPSAARSMPHALTMPGAANATTEML